MRGNFFYKRLGRKIIRTRRFSRLSQEGLALLSKIDRTYLVRLEKGKSNPTLEIIYRICRCMKVRLYLIFKGM